ncbi:MAG TPA: M17 family peptidase N-terminal domain-containing protein, partial [Rhodanobacteraceae bacterium]|nr:M17 family peptidase N-terminal domain-containing protein [Rhodanobacteraceae bacterium]
MLEFSLSSAAADTADTPCVVAGVFDGAPAVAAAALDHASGGALTRLRESGDFSGKPGATLILHGVTGVKSPRVLLVGLGRKEDFDGRAYARACADAGSALKGLPIERATLWLPEVQAGGHDAN